MNALAAVPKKQNRRLLYQLGMAGFAFGNIMFLSLPEYFTANEFWLDQYKYVFRWLIFFFSLPVLFLRVGTTSRALNSALKANGSPSMYL